MNRLRILTSYMSLHRPDDSHPIPYMNSACLLFVTVYHSEFSRPTICEFSRPIVSELSHPVVSEFSRPIGCEFSRPIVCKFSRPKYPPRAPAHPVPSMNSACLECVRVYHVWIPPPCVVSLYTTRTSRTMNSDSLHFAEQAARLTPYIIHEFCRFVLSHSVQCMNSDSLCVTEQARAQLEGRVEDATPHPSNSDSL